MGTIASQITSLTIVYSTVYSSTIQRKHQSSASLAFVRGFHRWPVISPHRWPVPRKMYPFDGVIMNTFGIYSPKDFNNPVTCSTMVNCNGFRLLLAATLNVCYAQLQGETTEMCQLENTRGSSTASSLISRSSRYPSSCPVVCSQSTECVATTYDVFAFRVHISRTVSVSLPLPSMYFVIYYIIHMW